MTTKQQVVITLPKPHSKQIPVLQSKAHIRILKCGRQSGKSTVALIIAIQEMLAGRIVAYICHEFDLSKKFYYSLLKILPKELIRKSNSSSLSIELTTGGIIQFYSGNATDTLMGNTIHFCICDEFAHWRNPEESYNEHISPILARYNGKMLILSSPLGKNFFYTMWLRGENCTDGYFESFYFTCYDNPYLSLDYLQRKEAELSKKVWQQEYLALESANSNSICDVEDVEKNTIKQLSTKQPVCYGIDIAKHHDYSVVTGLDEEGVMCYFDRWNGSHELTLQKIKALPASVLKVMDASKGSQGDVIFELLRNAGCQNLTPFYFTGESKPKLITELIFDIEKGNIKYNEITAQELMNYQYTISPSGNLKYGGISGTWDDCVISLAIANKYKKQVPQNFMSSFGWG